MSGRDDDEHAAEETDAEETDAAEAAWRAIVDNYGDRPGLPPEPDEPRLDVDAAEHAVPAPGPGAATDDAERFVPPPPPPLPRPTPPQLAAWLGVLGAPVLLLLVVVLDLTVPGLVRLALVAWFLGGFGYLIATMSNQPRDPWDDGSRI